MPGIKTRLTDEQGRQFSLVTESRCVEMGGGKTLADCEPTVPLVSIEHDLDAFPYVMLLHMREGHSAALIPTGVVYPSRGEVVVYTVEKNWGGPPSLRKIRSREYIVTFDKNDVDSIYIRLI